MSGFTILWAFEAEGWIQYHEELYEEIGGAFVGVYTPSEEEKQNIESEMSLLFDYIHTLGFKLMELQIIHKRSGYLEIYLEIPDMNEEGVYIDVWYEPSYSAVFFQINKSGELNDVEVARIIFEDIPSVDYSSPFV